EARFAELRHSVAADAVAARPCSRRAFSAALRRPPASRSSKPMSRRSRAVRITLASGVVLLGLAVAATQVAEQRFRVVVNNEPVTGHVRAATEAGRENASRFLI